MGDNGRYNTTAEEIIMSGFSVAAICFEPIYLDSYIIDSEPFKVYLDYTDVGFYVYYYDSKYEISFMLKNSFWCQDIYRRGEALFATKEEAVETLNKYYNVLDLDLGVLE